MNKKSPSFKRQLTKSLLIWGFVLWLLSATVATFMFIDEYDEQVDLSLETAARLLLPLAETKFSALNTAAQIPKVFSPDLPSLNPNEQFLFHIIDRTGSVVLVSSLEDTAFFDGLSLQEGFVKHQGRQFYTTNKSNNGNILQMGIPLGERNAAIRDNIIGLAISFLFFLPFMLFSTRYLARKYGTFILNLSLSISSKNETDLSPIIIEQSFSELNPAINSVNSLLERLKMALHSERNFSTNVAHELRTPLAISLAHTQRLKASSNDADIIARSSEIEAGLKRLADLIGRLLELSRSDTGLGLSANKTEISQIIDLVVDEFSRSPINESKIKFKRPISQFYSFIDPDALAIIVSNLIDNALKHSPVGAVVSIDATRIGIIKINNDCEAVSDEDLKIICDRFQRGSGKVSGFGIGLSIVQALCRQSGCQLQIVSPCFENGRGFEVIINLPLANMNKR